MACTASQALSMFLSGERVAGLETIKSGNINDTYAVYIEGKNGVEYTLQRINGYVFKDPERIMSNIARVTAHIADKFEESGLGSENRVIVPITSCEGKTFYIDSDGDFWRMYPFIRHSVCYNEVSDPKVMTMIGKAFGDFQRQLADFPADTLFTTIPDFHNTGKRYAKLHATVGLDPVGRAESVSNEIDYLTSIERIATQIDRLVESGKMVTRVTHNDTKSNNVLLDETTNEPLAVIDLDTVMPGLAVHDFGDAVRFAANKSSEDEADLRNVGIDIEKYDAFARGFIPPLCGALTKIELENMALGAVTMAAELSTRFLEDYIAGDVYFKTAYDKHNLVRARCQIALANDMLLKYDKMCNAITRYM